MTNTTLVFLASVNSVDSEQSILPKLSSLVLSECPFPDRLFQKPWTRIKSFTLTGTGTVISGLCTVISKGTLPNLAELNAQYCESHTATIRKLDPEKLPCLKSLTLNGHIHSIEEFEGLCSKASKWDLKKLDIGYSIGSDNPVGHLAALFRYPFPSLHTFVLRDCWLRSEDLSSLVRASKEGKLPNLELLDISLRDFDIFGELLSLLHHSLPSLKTLILSNFSLIVFHLDIESIMPLDIRGKVKVQELFYLKRDPVSGKVVKLGCFKFSFVRKQ